MMIKLLRLALSNTLSILVDSQSTSTTTPIMEIPTSSIINNEACEPLVVDSLTTTLEATTVDIPSHFPV